MAFVYSCHLFIFISFVKIIAGVPYRNLVSNSSFSRDIYKCASKPNLCYFNTVFFNKIRLY